MHVQAVPAPARFPVERERFAFSDLKVGAAGPEEGGAKGVARGG